MTTASKKTLLISLCIALSIALFLPCLFANARSVADYSRKGYAPKSISAARFLQESLNITPSQEETDYLDTRTDLNVLYNDDIPASVVTAVFDSASQSVEVSAKSYGYAADNGQTVTWSPTEVNGVPLLGTVTVPADENDYVSVKFESVLSIDKTVANTILNAYYRAAKAQSDALKEHNRQTESYNLYLQEEDHYRNVLLPEYENYLQKLAEWQRKYDAYNAYLAEYEQYLAEKEAYDNYDEAADRARYDEEMSRYQQYKVEMEIYEQLLAEYNEKLNSEDLIKYRGQLRTLEYIRAKCENRSLYGAITGDTVTLVLSHKEDLRLALAVTNLDKNAVDKADKATRNLRNLLSNLDACSSDEEKYAFYVTCYDDLKLNFCNLLRCLDYFYRSDMVREQIQNKNKDMQYRILLAQLYEIANALSDEKIGNYEKAFLSNKKTEAYFDENWNIGGTSPLQILGDCVLDDADDAQPLENGVPFLPVEPSKPTEVAEPKPPQRPPLPIAPQQVAEPSEAPERQERPVEPQPVAEPEPFNPTEEEQKLQRSFDAGLQPREEITQNAEITLSAQVKKYFRNAQTVSVYFFDDAEATDYYYHADVQRGDMIQLPQELPVRSEKGYACTFDGWVFKDGSYVDWYNLPDGEELFVYPKFTKTPNLYEVVWEIDGVQYRQNASFGEIPQYDGVPQKADDPDGRAYRFVGWDKPLVEMTEEPARYTALFEASFLITWITDGEKTVTACWKGDTPAYPYGTPEKEPSGFYAYVFDEWDKPLVPAVSDEVYEARFGAKTVLAVDGGRAYVRYEDKICTAIFNTANQRDVDIGLLLEIADEKGYAISLNVNNGATTIYFSAADVYEMARAGARYYTFDREQTGFREYRYFLELCDNDLRQTDIAVQARVTVSDAMNAVNTRLHRETDPETPLRIQLSDGKATFAMETNTRYFTVTRYNVYLSSSNEISLTVSATSDLKHNDTVTITYGEVPAGKRLVLKATDDAGKEVEIVGDRFTIGSGDVTLFAILTDVYYTVTFKSEGKVISTRTYKYGEVPELPVNPFKAPDGEFSYEFDGWDKQVTAVTADEVYNAVFIATPLEEIRSEMSAKVKLAISLAAIGGAALIALAIALPVAIVKKRKKVAAHNAANNGDNSSR